jgi:alpha-glucosidase
MNVTWLHLVLVALVATRLHALAMPPQETARTAPSTRSPSAAAAPMMHDWSMCSLLGLKGGLRAYRLAARSPTLEAAVNFSPLRSTLVSPLNFGRSCTSVMYPLLRTDAVVSVERSGRAEFIAVVRTKHPSRVEHWGGSIERERVQHVTARVVNRGFATSNAYFSDSHLWVMVVAGPLLGSRREAGSEPSGEDNTLEQGSRYVVTRIARSPTETHFVVKGVSGIDVYVQHASSSNEARALFYGLTGAPRMPPLWALGFMLSRWGWKNHSDVRSALDQMDALQVPMDGFAVDFEWYFDPPGGDYPVPVTGIDDFPDFNFSPNMFPTPAEQAKDYSSRGVRALLIRKPRLTNAQMLSHLDRLGCLLRPGLSRDVDFAVPQCRVEYARLMSTFLSNAPPQGVLPAAWWNDEGETTYLTFHHWLAAEQLASTTVVLNTTSPDHKKRVRRRRRFSINRSFTPGMQRLEAVAVWTGDSPSTWSSLQRHVDLLLQWSEAGVSLPSMDIGGYGEWEDTAPELLVRWYQLGVFTGVMRVHSHELRTPRFPFPVVWGQDEAESMKRAVQLRYAFLPSLYAAHHVQCATGRPLQERSVLGPEYFTVFANNLLVRPIVVSLPNMTTLREYESEVLEHVKTLGWLPLQICMPDKNSSYGDLLSFTRPGSVLLVDETPNLMRTRQILGTQGNLTVLVHWGLDGTALLVEDDGLHDGGLRRETRFVWSHAAAKLSWIVLGDADAPRWYSTVKVKVMYHLNKEEGQQGQGGEGSVAESVGRLDAEEKHLLLLNQVQ